MKYLILLLIVICSFAVSANADLQNLGEDSLGNKLIYDTDLDVTWYDYTNIDHDWYDQTDWVSGLTVNFGGNIYDDWRLPTTTQPDSSCGWQEDFGAGFPLQGYGYNCTGSEMGHLYYTELGNTGGFGGFTNTGDFQNLMVSKYFTGTELAPNTSQAWYFHTQSGYQDFIAKTGGSPIPGYGLAVRSGLAVVPEPISSTLFIVGGATLGFRRFIKRKHS